MTTLDPERRGALLGAQLNALVRDRFGIEGGELGTLPDGATLVAGRRGWFMEVAGAKRMLGAALAWARQAHLDELHLLVPGGDGALARRAALFERPPTVWRIVGRELEPSRAEPYPEELPHPDGIETLVELLHLAGLEVVCQHGLVSAEVLGLEVARVVSDGSGSRLEVGVGRNDREAFALLHGDLPAAEALTTVVETVRRHRRAGARDHPLGRLVPERWLRARILEEPALVGMSEIRPVEPLDAPEGLKESVPAAAVGIDAQGRSCVVVCSVGVDLDLVPYAADLRAREAERARREADRLLLVVPARDAHPVTEALAGLLRTPAEVIAVEGDWRG